MPRTIGGALLNRTTTIIPLPHRNMASVLPIASIEDGVFKLSNSLKEYISEKDSTEQARIAKDCCCLLQSQVLSPSTELTWEEHLHLETLSVERKHDHLYIALVSRRTALGLQSDAPHSASTSRFNVLNAACESGTLQLPDSPNPESDLGYIRSTIGWATKFMSDRKERRAEEAPMRALLVLRLAELKRLVFGDRWQQPHQRHKVWTVLLGHLLGRPEASAYVRRQVNAALADLVSMGSMNYLWLHNLQGGIISATATKLISVWCILREKLQKKDSPDSSVVGETIRTAIRKLQQVALKSQDGSLAAEEVKDCCRALGVDVAFSVKDNVIHNGNRYCIDRMNGTHYFLLPHESAGSTKAVKVLVSDPLLVADDSLLLEHLTTTPEQFDDTGPDVEMLPSRPPSPEMSPNLQLGFRSGVPQKGNNRSTTRLHSKGGRGQKRKKGDSSGESETLHGSSDSDGDNTPKSGGRSTGLSSTTHSIQHDRKKKKSHSLTAATYDVTRKENSIQQTKLSCKKRKDKPAASEEDEVTANDNQQNDGKEKASRKKPKTNTVISSDTLAVLKSSSSVATSSPPMKNAAKKPAVDDEDNGERMSTSESSEGSEESYTDDDETQRKIQRVTRSQKGESIKHPSHLIKKSQSPAPKQAKSTKVIMKVEPTVNKKMPSHTKSGSKKTLVAQFSVAVQSHIHAKPPMAKRPSSPINLISDDEENNSVNVTDTKEKDYFPDVSRDSLVALASRRDGFSELLERYPNHFRRAIRIHISRNNTMEKNDKLISDMLYGLGNPVAVIYFDADEPALPALNGEAFIQPLLSSMNDRTSKNGFSLIPAEGRLVGSDDLDRNTYNFSVSRRPDCTSSWNSLTGEFNSDGDNRLSGEHVAYGCELEVDSGVTTEVPIDKHVFVSDILHRGNLVFHKAWSKEFSMLSPVLVSAGKGGMLGFANCVADSPGVATFTTSVLRPADAPTNDTSEVDDMTPSSVFHQIPFHDEAYHNNTLNYRNKNLHNSPSGTEVANNIVYWIVVDPSPINILNFTKMYTAELGRLPAVDSTTISNEDFCCLEVMLSKGINFILVEQKECEAVLTQPRTIHSVITCMNAVKVSRNFVDGAGLNRVQQLLIQYIEAHDDPGLIALAGSDSRMTRWRDPLKVHRMMQMMLNYIAAGNPVTPDTRRYTESLYAASRLSDIGPSIRSETIWSQLESKLKDVTVVENSADRAGWPYMPLKFPVQDQFLAFINDITSEDADEPLNTEAPQVHAASEAAVAGTISSMTTRKSRILQVRTDYPGLEAYIKMRMLKELKSSDFSPRDGLTSEEHLAQHCRERFESIASREGKDSTMLDKWIAEMLQKATELPASSSSSPTEVTTSVVPDLDAVSNVSGAMEIDNIDGDSGDLNATSSSSVVCIAATSSSSPLSTATSMIHSLMCDDSVAAGTSEASSELSSSNPGSQSQTQSPPSVRTTKRIQAPVLDPCGSTQQNKYVKLHEGAIRKNLHGSLVLNATNRVLNFDGTD